MGAREEEKGRERMKAIWTGKERESPGGLVGGRGEVRGWEWRNGEGEERGEGGNEETKWGWGQEVPSRSHRWK